MHLFSDYQCKAKTKTKIRWEPTVKVCQSIKAHKAHLHLKPSTH